MKINKTLATLLRYSKMPRPNTTWRSVAKILSPIYGREMNLPDVIEVLVTTYEEALSEPRFELGNGRYAARELILAPIKGLHALDWPEPKGLNSSYTAEQFYNAMIKNIISQFSISRIDWCCLYSTSQQDAPNKIQVL